MTPVEEMLKGLDDDHARLRELGGRILSAIEANDVEGARRDLLALQLAQDTHFRFEERLMAEIAYPGHQVHAQDHLQLSETLAAINRALGSSRIGALSQELAAFIDDSLNHVDELDSRLRTFLTGLAAPSG